MDARLPHRSAHGTDSSFGEQGWLCYDARQAFNSCRCESGRVCKAAIDTAAWLQFCLNRANLNTAPEGLRSAGTSEEDYLTPRVYKQKVAAQKGRPLLCRETVLDCLPLEEAPRHAKRAEGCPEQHYRGAAVRSPGPAWAKECPTRKAISIPLCGDGEAG